MSVLNEITLYSRNLANAGAGVDKDGAYGFQCADLPCFVTKKWAGIDLWGNAADLLDSARSQGLKVVDYSPGIKPRAGWIFVMRYVAGDGVNYGHTGIVIEDSDGETMITVEQNLAGDLTVGSPARYHQRNFSEMMGFIVLGDSTEATVADSEPTQAVETELVAEKGTFTLTQTAINVRRAPSLTGDMVAIYQVGETVHYDGKLTAGGYRWISFVGRSGKRNYMAIGQVDSKGNRVSLWGKIA